MSSAAFVSFWLNDFLFGIEVGLVQEVVRGQALTSIPLAPPSVCGLLNLRGQIVTALDLRPCLQLPPADPGADPVFIVTRTAEGVISLMVDDIDDVVDVTDLPWAPPPETLGGTAREVIRGSYTLADRLLLALDVGRTVTQGTSFTR
jgi:purine-binding chemotaxis protein CheW